MYKIVLVLITYCTSVLVDANEIAITFDDAPRPDSRLLSGDERTLKLIENLKKANVPDVYMFLTTKNINETTKKRVKAYTDAGYHLANHSHSHHSANRVKAETYAADISLAHEKLKEFENVVPFYRYPYLKEGQDKITRDHIRNHLQAMNYRNGYVTVDNYDWYMDSLLQQALNDGKTINYEALKKAYVKTLWESITFYDNIAKKALSRSPKHVLLLHENDMAALYIGDLVAHIRAKGWKIISPTDAYEDPIAYTIPDVLFNGQGRVAAIAKSKGWDEKLLRDEGSSEDYLDEYFKNNKVFE